MRREKIYFNTIILLLVVAIVGSSLAMFNGSQKGDSYSVSVIVNNSNNSRWTAMRQGLEQAAKDYGIDMDFVSTGEINSLEEEMQLINREIESGADGIIIQFVDSQVDQEAMAAITSRTDLVLIGTDASPSELYNCVSPDNEAIGDEIAQNIQADMGDELEGKKIGIISGNQKQFAMQQRLSAFISSFANSGASIEWIIEGRTGNGISELRHIQITKPVDIIVSLGNKEMEQAIDYVNAPSVQRKLVLYGVGNSEKSVYNLDNGTVRFLVVPNEFNMGYESVEVLVNHIDFPLLDIEKREVSCLIANRDNLYNKENQKILFPIVQ